MAIRILTVFLMLFTGVVWAGDDDPAPITAENVHGLKLSHTVRFDEFPALSAEESKPPLSGWFNLSPDGRRAAFVVDGGVRIVDVDHPDAPYTGWTRDGATVIDARWDSDSRRLAVIDQHESGFALVVSDGVQFTAYDVPVAGMPVRVWFDALTANYVWVEATPGPEDPDRSGFLVARLDLTAPDLAPITLPTGPEHDFDSFVRIGRIPAPLAITATFEGTVRRWDLQTGEITAEVELPFTPIFGRVNETVGGAFAWRDEAGMTLHLLDFETGEDRVIAPLDGGYIQALMLSPDTGVILAVHRGEKTDVTAWIVETGEEIALGDYDTSICSRVPDMVQLAENGSRLVIGCDAGYQVWYVQE